MERLSGVVIKIKGAYGFVRLPGNAEDVFFAFSHLRDPTGCVLCWKTSGGRVAGRGDSHATPGAATPVHAATNAPLPFTPVLPFSVRALAGPLRSKATRSSSRCPDATTSPWPSTWW